MKTMRRLGYSLGLGAALVMGGNTAMAAGPSDVPDPGQPTMPPHFAVCSSGTTQVDWTGKNPKNCDRGYMLWEKNADGTKGALAAHFMGGPDKTGWAAIEASNDKAQAWCRDQTLTCALLTGAGFLLLGPLAQSQS